MAVKIRSPSCDDVSLNSSLEVRPSLGNSSRTADVSAAAPIRSQALRLLRSPRRPVHLERGRLDSLSLAIKRATILIHRLTQK